MQGAQVSDQDCLYFIERGYVSIKRDPQQSLKLTSQHKDAHPHLFRAQFRTFR
jgi:hypothetical protein